VTHHQRLTGRDIAIAGFVASSAVRSAQRRAVLDQAAAAEAWLAQTGQMTQQGQWAIIQASAIRADQRRSADEWIVFWLLCGAVTVASLLSAGLYRIGVHGFTLFLVWTLTVAAAWGLPIHAINDNRDSKSRKVAAAKTATPPPAPTAAPMSWNAELINDDGVRVWRCWHDHASHAQSIECSETAVAYFNTTGRLPA
jgi:hypothetical protein